MGEEKSMDLAILQRIALELDELLPGRFVTRIHQPLPRDIVLRTRSRSGPEIKLMISADPALGRIHTTDLKIPNPASPPRFCAFLRARFQGSRILRVWADPDDRVVHILGQKGLDSERSETELILELLGRDSNIILVDRRTNKILECLHRIPEKEAGLRAVLPAREYLPPPKRQRSGLLEETEVRNGDTVPGIITEPDGKKRLCLNAAGDRGEKFPSMNHAADAFFTPRLRSALVETLRNDLSGKLKSRIRALDRRVGKIEADARRLKELTNRQVEGEFLKANLQRIKKGMTSVEVSDWETGGTRTIALDPSLSPVANMKKIFKKAAKGKRGEEKVLERLQSSFEEKRALEDCLYFVHEAPDIESLEAAALEMPVTKAGPRKEPPRAGTRTKQESRFFHQYQTPEGRDVLVGRNAQGNDFLVRHKARKGDLWFHVKDFPGSHVLLRAGTADLASSGDREFAAGLAVYFSKALGKGRVEVIIADAAALERPKGALPGQVRVKSFKTILSDQIIPEPSGLKSHE